MTGGQSFEALDNLNEDELRQRLQSLQAIIARAPVPIAIAHDPECRFISANHALSSLLRLPDDANISLTPPPGERPPYRIQRNGRDLPADELPMQYAIAHRTAVANDIEMVLADGTVVYVQNDVELLFDTKGRIYGCVSVCIDMTRQRLAEIALRDADRRKDEFLATLSHELRNPLAPMRTAIEIMRVARGDADLVEKARTTLERQLHQLVRLTDDLLDVSRITHDKVELRRERIDLRAVLQASVESMRPTIDSHEHTLTLDLPKEPLWANADFARLAQAFSNLLSNAAKYTPRGGRIHVAASAAGDFATVSVSDTGVGISPTKLPRIFDMFTQLQEHGDRTYGGLGIGLTLAKRLIELHGGTIEASSEGPGRGSVFTVRLPTAAVACPGDTLSRDGDSRPVGPCRVLVAEDHPDSAEMMRLMLSFKGHDVRIADDGERAVAIAEEFEPQIAFLDIGMPRLDGYEAARRIRARLGSRVLLVALTGWGQDEEKRRSHEAGFDHHLTKPPEPEILDRLIADCIDRDATRERRESGAPPIGT
jgi:signal transduction histidine kinase/ActR/RegA family two-component response regulator